MGSLGEEELDQLVRDYIEPAAISIDHPKNTSKHNSVLLSLKEAVGKFTEEEMEIQQKITAYSKKMRFEGDLQGKKNMKRLASKLRSHGYDASLCKTSWDSSFDRREGVQVFRFTENYEYIDVMMEDRANGNRPKKRVIIDLDFRSQFELVKSTKAYREIIEMLPLVFVGSEEKLNKVLSLVCSASKQSMKEKEMYIPPWRKLSYMQAKWLSNNCKKVSVSARNFGLVDEEECTSGANNTNACCLSIF